MQKVKKYIKVLFIVVGSIILITLGLILSLEKIPVSDHQLEYMLKKQYKKAVDFDDNGPFDVLLLGRPQMEIADFGLIYYIRHLGAVPITHRRSVALIKLIHAQQLNEIKRKDQTYKEWLLNEYSQ